MCGIWLPVHALLNVALDIAHQSSIYTCFYHQGMVLQAYVDAIVETGEVKVGSSHEDKQVQTILSHIARTAPTSSGLRTLTVDASILTSSTAALLAHSLLHHASSLTTLHMPFLACVASNHSHPAEAAFSSLCRLSLITSLKLGCISPCTFSGGGGAETVEALAASISRLPNLTTFTLHNMNISTAASAVTEAAPPANKRRRVCRAAGGRPPVSLDPVIAALSTAPALTLLTLSFERDSTTTLPLPCSGIAGPFSSLRRLRLTVQSDANLPDATIAADRSVLPTALLPDLRCLDVHFNASAIEPEFSLAIVNSVMQQVELRELQVFLCHLPEPAAAAIEHGFGRLCNLSNLSVWFGCDVSSTTASVRAAAAGFAALPALTRLELCALDACVFFDDGGEALVLEEDVQCMLQPLAAAVGLRDLRCDFKEYPGAGLSYAAVDALVHMPLRALTRLTRLEVRVEGDSIAAGDLAPQLRVLTGLQRLRLTGVTHSAAGQLQGCLERLVHLTHLHLSLQPVSEQVLKVIGGCLGAMTGLTRLKLSSCARDRWPHFLADSDWVQGILHMPRRGTYEFYCQTEEIEDEVYEDIRRQVAERGGRADEYCMNVEY